MPTYAYRTVNGNGAPEFERRGDHLYPAGGFEPVATIYGNEIYVGHGAASIPDAIVGSDGRVHAGASEGPVIFGISGNEIRAGGAMGEVLFWAPDNPDPMTLAAAALVTVGDPRLRKTGRDDTHASQLGGMPEIWEKHWNERGYHGDAELHRTDDNRDNPGIDSSWGEHPDYGSDWHKNLEKSHAPRGSQGGFDSNSQPDPPQRRRSSACSVEGVPFDHPNYYTLQAEARDRAASKGLLPWGVTSPGGGYSLADPFVSEYPRFGPPSINYSLRDIPETFLIGTIITMVGAGVSWVCNVILLPPWVVIGVAVLAGLYMLATIYLTFQTAIEYFQNRNQARLDYEEFKRTGEKPRVHRYVGGRDPYNYL